MLPESFIILWENTTIYYLLSCVISILAAFATFHYTRNLQVKEVSSARDDERSGNPLAEQEIVKSEFSPNAAAGDTKIEKDDQVISTRSNAQDVAGGDNADSDADPMRDGPDVYVNPDRIPNNLKKAKDKMLIHQLEANMSEDQKILEKKIQREQLAEIYKLVEESGEKYGITSVADMEEQMKLYSN